MEASIHSSFTYQRWGCSIAFGMFTRGETPVSMERSKPETSDVPAKYGTFLKICQPIIEHPTDVFHSMRPSWSTETSTEIRLFRQKRCDENNEENPKVGRQPEGLILENQAKNKWYSVFIYASRSKKAKASPAQDGADEKAHGISKAHEMWLSPEKWSIGQDDWMHVFFLNVWGSCVWWLPPAWHGTSEIPLPQEAPSHNSPESPQARIRSNPPWNCPDPFHGISDSQNRQVTVLRRTPRRTFGSLPEFSFSAVAWKTLGISLEIADSFIFGGGLFLPCWPKW